MFLREAKGQHLESDILFVFDSGWNSRFSVSVVCAIGRRLLQSPRMETKPNHEHRLLILADRLVARNIQTAGFGGVGYH